MTTALEIIIPVRDPGPELDGTIASLTAQTDQAFGVILSDNHSSEGLEEIDAAEEKLLAAGLTVRRLRPPAVLGRVEHWNWAHLQGRSAWLKPLLSGECLKPAYVERLKQCVREQPQAQLVRCDAELRTEWGIETVAAPFAQRWLPAGEFLQYFPAHVAWMGNLLNVAFSRVAWTAAGGFDIHFPACAALNLNCVLALHYGMVNLPEALVRAESAVSLNATAGGRVNLWLELWLTMQQLRNGCLAAKQVWPRRGVLRGVWQGQSLHAEPA